MINDDEYFSLYQFRKQVVIPLDLPAFLRECSLMYKLILIPQTTPSIIFILYMKYNSHLGGYINAINHTFQRINYIIVHINLYTN